MAKVRNLSASAEKKRRKQRRIWMVWVEKVDHRGQTIADIRAIEETAEGANFVVDVIKLNEKVVRIWVEPRVTHHIYAHQDVLLSMRLVGKYTKYRGDGD